MSHKPTLAIRRPPKTAPETIENFVSGNSGAPSPIPSPAPSDLGPAVAPQRPLIEPDAPIIAMYAPGNLEEPPFEAEELPGATVEPTGEEKRIRPGIVQRRSGRVRRRTTVYLDPKLVRDLLLHCADLEIDMSDVVEDGLRKHLESIVSSRRRRRTGGARSSASQMPESLAAGEPNVTRVGPV